MAGTKKKERKQYDIWKSRINVNQPRTKTQVINKWVHQALSKWLYSKTLRQLVLLFICILYGDTSESVTSSRKTIKSLMTKRILHIYTLHFFSPLLSSKYRDLVGLFVIWSAPVVTESLLDLNLWVSHSVISHPSLQLAAQRLRACSDVHHLQKEDSME